MYNSTLYDHFLAVMPSGNTVCGYAYGTLGCDQLKDYADGCWASVSQCGQMCLTLHELGHNLGLFHAGKERRGQRNVVHELIVIP